MCGDEIYFDIEECLSLQVEFIKRLGVMDINSYKEKTLAKIDKYLSLSKYEVYNLISQTFKDMIYDLHCGGKYVKIETDERIVENFTRNFHDLHDNLCFINKGLVLLFCFELAIRQKYVYKL